MHAGIRRIQGTAPVVGAPAVSPSFPAEFQRTVAGGRLGNTPDELPGGHLVAFSHPQELADRLEAYRRAQRFE